jgi:hypothetical protein
VYVINNKSGKKVPVVICKLDAEEIRLINKTKRFSFNWNKEKCFEVYKLSCADVDEPLGLLSIEEHTEDYAIQIRLLASSRENVGEGKLHSRIAGCLISFACKRAFRAGFNGYIYLKSKTNLEKHYCEVYGMISTKMYLVTEGRNSLKLINKYYEDKDSPERG